MNPEIIYCEQGSEDWFKAKCGIISASHFSDVLAKGQGKTRRKYMMKIIAERRTGISQPSYQNEAMQWGIETEAAAREYYEAYTHTKVEQVGFIRLDIIGCSPDGLLDTEGGLEIKCPDTVTHYEYILANRLPCEYVAQVQGNLMVTGRKWWDFVSFDPRDRWRPFWTIRVERDEKYIDNLKEELDKFINELHEIENQINIPI